MTTNHRAILVLVAALVVAGALIRQEVNIHRLRMAIAEVTSIQSEGTAAIPTLANPHSAENEELRREAAEVRHLRAEVAQLRRETVATSALQESVEKLAAEVSAISENSGGRSVPISSIDGFNRHASNESSLASQASALARSSPEEAARWVASLPTGEEQDQAALAVLARWLNSDSVAAATWASQFPEGPLREQAMFIVARNWGLQDLNGTAAWLRTLPMGPSRDAAIGAFVTSADGNDIQLALEWANAMENPQSRFQRVEATARRWLREDNPAARAWIQNARLPEGIAGRLLSGD